MSTSPDILIVGAGIVGAACAAACSRLGWKVTVLDQGPVGGGTTGAGMGHLVVMDDSEAQFALTSFSRQLWRQLASELPAEVEYDPCGTLWVAADAEELEVVHRKAAFYGARGVRTETLDPQALASAEPNLRPGLAGGLLVPDDSVIYPPSAARYLLEQAQQRGAHLRLGCPVRALLPEGGVALAGGERLAAAVVVNAAGCAAPLLTPGLPIRRRKGHLVITDRYPGFIRHQIVELGYLKSAHTVAADSVAFNVQPRRTGQLLIGSSRQYGADDLTVHSPLLQRMLRRATEYLPGLPRLSALRVWTGHRAATPDKLPLIGPWPEQKAVWLATGHEGLGITTSLATAELLVGQLQHQPAPIPAEPYLPARLLASQPAHA